MLETLGLGWVFYYLIHGLKTKISALESTIRLQSQTLDVMERRVQETEKVGHIYKNLLSDLPRDLENYKTIVSKTKDEVILELQEQNRHTKKELEAAEKTIENSNLNPDVIKQHLRVLKNILSRPKSKTAYAKNEYDLLKVCTYNNKSLEESIPLILEAKTFKEFAHKIGFKTFQVIDKPYLDDSSFKKEQTPLGVPLKTALAAQSGMGFWYIMANDEIHISRSQLDHFNIEFVSVKE